MPKQLKVLFSTLLILIPVFVIAARQVSSETSVLGFWKADAKTLTIEIYKNGPEYRARLISFTDHHNATPSALRKDDNNPNPALRNRYMIGMDVLHGLAYNKANGKWVDGKIYDAKSGREYSADLEMSNGKLFVRAYKGFTVFGKTLSFHR